MTRALVLFVLAGLAAGGCSGSSDTQPLEETFATDRELAAYIVADLDDLPYGWRERSEGDRGATPSRPSSEACTGGWGDGLEFKAESWGEYLHDESGSWLDVGVAVWETDEDAKAYLRRADDWREECWVADAERFGWESASLGRASTAVTGDDVMSWQGLAGENDSYLLGEMRAVRIGRVVAYSEALTVDGQQELVETLGVLMADRLAESSP